MKPWLKTLLSKVGIDADKIGKVLDFISTWSDRIKTAIRIGEWLNIAIKIGFVASLFGHYIGCHEYNARHEEHQKVLKDKDDSLKMYKQIIKLKEIEISK